MLMVSPWDCSLALGFCHPFSPLLSHSSGREWGCPIFSGFCLIRFCKFLPWILVSTPYLLFASCLVPMFLSHENLTGSCHSPPGGRGPHMKCQSQHPSSLRKVTGFALLLFQRCSACLPQWDLMYQSYPVGKSLFLFIEYWLSSGIQRIDGVEREGILKTLVLGNYIEENSRDSSFIYLFIWCLLTK